MKRGDAGLLVELARSFHDQDLGRSGRPGAFRVKLHGFEEDRAP